jgi:hypothetical protein
MACSFSASLRVPAQQNVAAISNRWFSRNLSLSLTLENAAGFVPCIQLFYKKIMDSRFWPIAAMTGGGGLDKSAASALPAPLIKETAAALASQNRFMVSSTLLLTS